MTQVHGELERRWISNVNSSMRDNLADLFRMGNQTVNREALARQDSQPLCNKAPHNKDTLHIKHHMTRTLCI